VRKVGATPRKTGLSVSSVTAMRATARDEPSARNRRNDAPARGGGTGQAKRVEGGVGEPERTDQGAAEEDLRAQHGGGPSVVDDAARARELLGGACVGEVVVHRDAGHGASG
jgi:hypothetical protein